VKLDTPGRFLRWVVSDDTGSFAFGGMLRALLFVLVLLFLISTAADVFGSHDDVPRSTTAAH
jgi:hypothetical protein